MKQRILTALPLGLLVAGLIWWGPIWLFLLLLVTAVEISLAEYILLSRQAGSKALPIISYLAAGALCLAQTIELRKPLGLVPEVLLAAIFLVVILALFQEDDLKGYFGASASTMFGVLYLGFTLSWLVPLRYSQPWGGREPTLFLFLVVWAGDAFAYGLGRWWGRHPFFPRVSPKKTLEGAVGGFAGSVLVGWGCGHWLWTAPGERAILLMAAIVAVAGQAGDLVESALKRSAGLKDSSGLLPGHGGLLDRIDSLVFAAPALWFAIVLQGFGK